MDEPDGRRAVRVLSWVALVWLAAAPVAGADGAKAEAGESACRLALAGALPDGKPLLLYLDIRGGSVGAAFGTSPTYNKAAHDVDASGLALEGGAVTGTVKVTVNADLWVPRDGRSVPCAYALDVRREGEGFAGTYTGTYGGESKSGSVVGEAFAPDERPARYRLGLGQALRRLAPRQGVGGSNTEYALDMWLSFEMADGRARDARFESPVPDYRPYSAIVERLEVTREGAALKGTATITVDYGRDPGDRYGSDAKRVEAYTYTLKGLAIGDAAVGAFDARVGAIDDRGRHFAGTVTHEPAPRPEASVGFLRCHGAMRGRAPVLLYLSLSDGERIHGYAYAPGYNHQPHTVDASGLTRDGDVVKGAVTVSVAPDCYKPPERFDVELAVDARIERGVIAGTFTSTDGDERFEGRVTGDLRPKKAPAATPETLATCELDLGYCLPSGPMPRKNWEAHQPNYASVRFHFKDGALERTEVFNPHDAGALKATVDRADMRLVGDRIAGSVAFMVPEAAVAGTGRYEFTFEGIVNGDRVSGFWRGKHEGKDILTKSAKLGGRLTAVGGE